MKRTLILLATAFFLGAVIGGAFYTADPEVRVVTKTKTVTETLEPEVVYETVVPEACQELGNDGATAVRVGRQFETHSSTVTRILTDLRVAIVMKDVSTINALETEFRKITSKNLGTVQTLAELNGDINTLANECQSGDEDD